MAARKVTLPAGWTRYEGPLLTIWRVRYERIYGEGSAEHYADGMFVRDHRRPIAQWISYSSNSAVLVAPETPTGWPVQRFAVYYAPPGDGLEPILTARHEWQPRGPRGSTTDADAFAAAVESAEQFLVAEAAFGAIG